MKPVTIKPQHAHNCMSTKCEFLGRVGSADMYVHEHSYGSVYVLRYSSEVLDYFSTIDYGNEELKRQKKWVSCCGDELYYRRRTGICLCATGIINLMDKENV